MFKSMIMVIAIAFSAASYADQCEIVEREQADQAAQILQQAQTAYDFCELCGDTQPTKIAVRSVSVKARSEGATVVVNGRGKDLAYLYDSAGNNLALQVGCDARDVSPSISAQ